MAELEVMQDRTAFDLACCGSWISIIRLRQVDEKAGYKLLLSLPKPM